MQVIPAVDVLGGKCVRLTEGDYSQVDVYGDDPAEAAIKFDHEGVEWLHVVDLDGAKNGGPVNAESIERIAKRTKLKLEVGGGVRELDHVRAWLGAGAKRVVLGTRLAKDEKFAEQVFELFGDQVVAGIDTKGGFVATHGWIETSTLDGLAFAQRLQALGCQRVIFTDVAKDGRLQGPNLEETRKMVYGLQIPVIASGGVAQLTDLENLAATGCEAAIVGKSLYEGRFTLDQAVKATRASSKTY